MSRNSIDSQSEPNGFAPTVAPPPPYTSVIYKLNEQPSWETYPPPTYSDIIDQFSAPNNYPGPPLTDGCVQVLPTDSSVLVPPRSLAKKLRVFLMINGVLTLIFGFAAIGLQVGLIVTSSILYYYYGFWAGALILSVGVNTLILIHHSNNLDLTRWIRSCFWEAMLVSVVFVIGIIIMTTDRCNDNGTDDDDVVDGISNTTTKTSTSCRPMNKILMGFIIGVIGATMVQTMISALFFRTIYNKLPRNSIVSCITTERE